MAAFPCDYCGRRYTGKQNTVYPAVVHNSLTYRTRGRICPDDLVTFEAVMEKADALNALAEMPNDCSFCQARPAPLAVFATLYVRGGDRQDLYARTCGPCLRSVVGPSLFPPVDTLFQALSPLYEVATI